MINEIRELRAEEIEVRPAHKVKDKIGMLLYIDSRAVTNYLDEWVGCMNWQTEFYEVNGQIIGKLGIWDDNKQMWVWKSDVGSESNIEKEKGLISDTYKRLLSRWGVTYLYTAPDILLEDDGYGNKGYKVSEISYNENKQISHLVITNKFGKTVFTWSINQNQQIPTYNTHVNNNTHNSIVEEDNLEWKPDNITILTDFCTKKKQEPNIDKDKLLKFFNYYKPKMDSWTGKLNTEQLFNKWMTN